MSDNYSDVPPFRYTEERFLVRDDWTCWCEQKRCWRQTYTGLPCKHTLQVVVDKLQMCPDRDERKAICTSVMELCNDTWFRKNYEVMTRRYPSLPPTHREFHRDEYDQSAQYVTRFRNVVNFLSPRTLECHLRSMEKLVLQPNDVTTTRSHDVITNSPKLPNPVLRYRNPRKRKRQNTKRVGVVDLS